MRRDEARLLDIILASRDAAEFAEGVSREQYLSDRMLQSAVCHKLEVIGEAARAVSDEFKTAHPEIPWADVVGLRNRIVHEYFRLDLDVIWHILQNDLPALMSMVEPLVPPPEAEER